jgi:(p)ppGpp synthase/HD superfamily hydrolase
MEAIDHPSVDAAERFERAFTFAVEWHRGQPRKGSNAPYISHLMAVSALVLEDGGDLDQAAAALLHDAVEDAGGLPRLAQIEEQLGPRVAEIVDGCTDAYTDPKPPWPERKLGYLGRIREETDEGILRVSAADKLHNVRAIIWDLKRNGGGVWEIFNAPAELVIGYYVALSEVYSDRLRNSFLPASLDRVLGELRRQTGIQPAAPETWRTLFQLEQEAEGS